MSGLARTETDTPMSDPKGTKSTMLPHKPEDWPRLFVEHLNSGDLEAVAALYAPNARFWRVPGKRSSAATGLVTC